MTPELELLYQLETRDPKDLLQADLDLLEAMVQHADVEEQILELFSDEEAGLYTRDKQLDSQCTLKIYRVFFYNIALILTFNIDTYILFYFFKKNRSQFTEMILPCEIPQLYIPDVGRNHIQ